MKFAIKTNTTWFLLHTKSQGNWRKISNARGYFIIFKMAAVTSLNGIFLKIWNYEQTHLSPHSMSAKFRQNRLNRLKLDLAQNMNKTIHLNTEIRFYIPFYFPKYIYFPATWVKTLSGCYRGDIKLLETVKNSKLIGWSYCT